MSSSNMLHYALGEDTAATHCRENSCSEWQQKLLHAFSCTIPIVKHPLLKERVKVPTETMPLSLSLFLSLSLSLSRFKALLKLKIKPQPMSKQMNMIDYRR
jgi:hypothetical protein